MRITEVKPRRRMLTEIFVDGESAGRISTEVWMRAGYRAGDTVSEEELEALLAESERYRAKEKALYLLEYRAHSKKELLDKVGRTVSREAAQEAVDRMEALGLMDDEKYARGQAAYLVLRKGYAAPRAVYALVQKGIDRELAEAVVGEVAPEPCDKLRELLKRKYPLAVSDEAHRRRAAAAMARLGYRYADIEAVLRALEEEHAADLD